MHALEDPRGVGRIVYDGDGRQDIPRIVQALSRLNDRAVTTALALLAERISPTPAREQTKPAPFVVPALPEVLCDEPHGVPYCR